MRAERLFRILGLVEADLIEEAVPASSAAASKRRGAPVWRQMLAAAACVTLVCGVGFAWLVTGGFQGFGSSAPATGAGGFDGGGGGSGHDEGTAFLSYAGPVFPLTTAEETPALTAERTVTWDFAPGTYDDGAPRQWGATVTDGYILTNPTEEDVTVTALYPFAGSLSALVETAPAVTVDGSAAETALYAGPYSGGFQDAGEGDGSTWNIAPLTSWEDYRELLADGAYQKDALSPWPELKSPVTIYAFTDFQRPGSGYPQEEFPAATQAVAFTIDESRTTVLSYGFEGMSWDEDTGWRQYSYFVPDGRRRSTEPKLLAVLGDDIGSYALQGYADGGCEIEIEGVSCTVTQEETTLNALIERLCERYAAAYAGETALLPPDAADWLSSGLFRGAVADLLTRYGPLSNAPVDRYGDGRLDDLLSEALSLDRVLYLAFPVTVPAGGSVSVTAAFWKEPSYDFACSGTGNEHIQGFDLVTRLGSTLDFTGQSAALANTEGVEIVRQSLGFDLERGVTEVPLDTAEEHYYLELRPLEAE